MAGGYINLVQVRPWWLRLAILVLIACPLFGVSALHTEIRPDHVFDDLAEWTAYSLFIWIIVGFVVGLDRLILWLSASALFGITVAISGAVIRKLGVWDAIEHLVRATTESQASLAQTEADLVLLLIRVTATVPVALLTLQSFPASDILKRAARPENSEHVREAWLLTAIAIRIFQHVFEIAGSMFLAWREENPQVLLPRYKNDWEKGVKGRLGFLGWLKTSVWAWSMGLLQQSLVFVPVAVRDWGKFADRTD